MSQPAPSRAPRDAHAAGRSHALSSGRRGAVLYAALIGAGLAGNYFNFPIFLNINFLFGSIFAMLALQFFGSGRGVIAAALIASYTYVLWNEPYALLIMTAEAAFVGWLVGRGRAGMVFADTLYWLLLGMPMAYLFYGIVLGVAPSSTLIIMVKQAVNGIANALIARLIFTAFALQSGSLLMSFREIVYNLLAFFVLIPALLMLAIASHGDFHETDRTIRTELHQDGLRIAERLETWVSNRATAIIHLAAMAATRTPGQMQSYIEMAAKSDLNYARVGLADAEAKSVAFYPLADELGKKTLGISFSERPYVPILKRTLRPMLSEVYMGKVGVPKPRLVLLAPVVAAGRYSGFVFGVLELGQLRDYLARSTDRSTALYTLLDRNGNIVLTNREDQSVLRPFVRGPGAMTRLDTVTSQWTPDVAPNTSISERWKDSFYVTETPVRGLAEWKLVLEQPVAPFQHMLYSSYADKLMLLFVILLAALALAEFMSRRVVATTEQLSEITQDLPAALVAGAKTEWPDSAVRETRRLVTNFTAMAATLAAQFAANRQLNENLELRVAERTRELEASLADLKRSNADLEQFAYAASHDMRQPLRMISSYLQLLEAELAPVLTEETRQNFAFATEGAKRIDQMLAALLDYSRIGRGSEARTTVDLREVLEEALRYLRPATAEAGAQISIRGEWPRLSVFRDEMLRLFQNLVDNAVKYRVPGRPPRIEVSAQMSAGEWCCAVRDNGVGLLPGHESRLFKVFERMQPRHRYAGTGIGLALCRRIVEHHDGRIWAESSGENQGCAFIFTLPAEPAMQDAADVSRAA